MKNLIVGLTALVAGSFLLSSCGSSERTRYKMTVEVETPQGLVSGYAVREIVRTTPPSIPMLGEDRGSVKVRGEAVAVDLPDGQTLFALLLSSTGGSDNAGFDIWSMLRQLDCDVIELWPNAARINAPIVLDPLPMLVRFRDIDDPTSVEQVDPADVAETLGEGYALKSIEISIADDRVTLEIEKRLEWLKFSESASLDRDFAPTTNPTLAQKLNYLDFRNAATK